jgi:hypothetical protein
MIQCGLTAAILLMAMVPVWTAPTAPVLAIEVVACLLCGAGVIIGATTPVTLGAMLGFIGYAVAVCVQSDGRVDVVGAAVFGLAVLFLLDLSEFARRFRGADIAKEVLRAQTVYWLGRVAIIAAAVMALTLGGFALSVLVPGGGRALVAGIGTILALAGALHTGIIRRPGDIDALRRGSTSARPLIDVKSSELNPTR